MSFLKSNLTIGNYSTTLFSKEGVVGRYATKTRFSNTVLSISNVNNANIVTHNIGILGEGAATATGDTVFGIGLYGKGYTYGSTRSTGVTGEGTVTASGDTGNAIGVRGLSLGTHAGGSNIGLYGNASGGLTNYALYMEAGDVKSLTAQTWTLGGNLTFSGAYSITIPTLSLTNALPVNSGGTGAQTLALNNVILGNGTNAVQTVAPGTSGNILTSNGTTWSSTAPATVSVVANLAGGNNTTLLGTIPYQSNTNTTSLLSPNVSTTKNFLSQTGTGTNGAAPVWSTVTKSDVGLGSVENTALSTWTGSTNITTLSTIGTGTWNATAIADGKIASALTGKTYNGLSLTAAATGFTIAGGTTSKTLTVSNTLTLSGTDASTLNIGSGGTLNSLSVAILTGTPSSSTYLRGDNTWATISGGATITNDVSTNANYYLGMSSTTSGNWTTAYTSNTKLYFNPSSGILSSTNFASLSDISFKENVTKITNATSIIKSLEGDEWNWKNNGSKGAGVIAQELEKVLPWLVEGDGVKTVTYNGLFGYLIEGFKELENRISKLEGI